MKKKGQLKSLLPVLIVCCLIGCCVYFFFQNYSQTYQNSMQKRGDEVVYEIELYIAQQGEVPPSLEVLFTNNQQVVDFFTLNKIDSVNYTLAFPLNSGKRVYHSATREWTTEKP